MRLIFILFLIGTFFILSLKTRIAGLYTYWWFAIFRPHDWVWNPIIHSLRLPLVAALLLVVPSLLQKKFPRINHPLATLMFLWVLLIFIADTLNGCSTMSIFRTKSVFDLFILIYITLLTCQLVNNPKRLFWLIFVLSMSIAFHAGKGGIRAFITNADNYGAHNLTGMFTGSNAYAMGTGMLLFFMIFTYQQLNSNLVFEKTGKWYTSESFIKIAKLFILIQILGSFYNIVSLQSRGAFLATTLGIILWLLFQKKVLLIILISTVLMFSAGAILHKHLPEGFTERIESVFVDKEELDKSAASRPHFWRTAADIVKVYPAGIGPGCYPGYYDRFDSSQGYFGFHRSVHSSHFQILADSGYLGLIVWILLFVISYKKLWQIKATVRSNIKDGVKRKFYIDLINMLICSQTVFLIGGSFYEYAYNDITWLTFALIIILDNIVKKDLEKQPSSKIINNSITENT